ncbi:MAG: nucleotidyltransferase family protein, partial [Clostridia bacterium]|nr:nucleotidyltransferase family protein [Clostridia bacterium]
MKFCAIICELNPLTNGHQYLINKAKEETNLPILTIMSGDFSQRAQMAILPKHIRASLAINAGATACLELPFFASSSVAELFALNAIKALNSLGCVSSVAFGHEWENFEDLKQIALFLSNPPKNFDAKIKEELKNSGQTYHTVLEKAIASFLPNIKIEKIYKGANNILAIEYLKAIIKTKSSITPLPILRKDFGHNTIKAKHNFLSATRIRDLVYSNKIKKIKKYVPSFTFDALLSNKTPNKLAFEMFLLNSLRNIDETNLKSSGENLILEKQLIKNAKIYPNFNEFVNATVSKRFREARINRTIL